MSVLLILAAGSPIAALIEARRHRPRIYRKRRTHFET